MKNQELLITKLSEQYAFNYRERHKPLRSLCFSLLSIDKSRIAKYHWSIAEQGAGRSTAGTDRSAAEVRLN